MKVIQVGMGGMGNAWIGAVQRSENVEFAGFVEINEAIAVEQAEKYGFDESTIFRDLNEAIDKLDIDGVINVTPPQFHKEISVIAMDAGIPVLCEKPLAGTLEDAQAIVDKSNQTGILHTVTQNYRYSQVAQTMKSVLDSGELGAIGAVSVQFFKGPHFGGFREEMPHPLIIDMSIHHFDMMRYFLDSNPTRIRRKAGILSGVGSTEMRVHRHRSRLTMAYRQAMSGHGVLRVWKLRGMRIGVLNVSMASCH